MRRTLQKIRKCISRFVRHHASVYSLYEWIMQTYYRVQRDDLRFITKEYEKHLHRDLDLANPQRLSEKIQWLKLYWQDSLAEMCSDKYIVREYVEEKVGKKYLNELLAVYDSVDEIKFDELPESFVLKTNHGSQWNIICPDKSQLNIRDAKIRLKRWMKTNLFWMTREWVYKNIDRKIICEKFLIQKDHERIVDYKIYCFDGKVKTISTIDWVGEQRIINTYDRNWEKIPMKKHGLLAEDGIGKPQKLDEMIYVCETLAEPFPMVRIDLYYIQESIIFGEMTFFAGSGFIEYTPDKFNYIIGEWLDLSKIKLGSNDELIND